jgi:predicted molibdopterin-dependent oxidoreductase YjgC
MSISITVDEKEIRCQENISVLDVARENGIDIPTMCHNPLFDEHRSGSCRLCVVQVLAGARVGLQSSCTLPVAHGMNISTRSEAVYQARRTIVELLLSEHVQDCRNCPTSGACNFAKLCRDYDLNGVSVCAECPNQKEGCLLSRGVLCLGPITYANCEAYCTRRGYRCEGCHSVVSDENVLRFGLQAYERAGFNREAILEGAMVFSVDARARIEKVMAELGMD